jgi:hypothetical protein
MKKSVLAFCVALILIGSASAQQPVTGAAYVKLFAGDTALQAAARGSAVPLIGGTPEVRSFLDALVANPKKGTFVCDNIERLPSVKLFFAQGQFGWAINSPRAPDFPLTETLVLCGTLTIRETVYGLDVNNVYKFAGWSTVQVFANLRTQVYVPNIVFVDYCPSSIVQSLNAASNPGGDKYACETSLVHPGSSPASVQYFISKISDGQLALQQGQLGVAADAYTAARDTRPERIEPYIGLARAYTASQPDQAIVQLQLAVRNGARIWDIVNNQNRELFPLMGTDSFLSFLGQSFGQDALDQARPRIVLMEKNRPSLDEKFLALLKLMNAVHTKNTTHDCLLCGRIPFVRTKDQEAARKLECGINYKFERESSEGKYKDLFDWTDSWSVEFDFGNVRVTDISVVPPDAPQSSIVGYQSWSVKLAFNKPVSTYMESNGQRRYSPQSFAYTLFANQGDAETGSNLLKSIASTCNPF